MKKNIKKILIVIITVLVLLWIIPVRKTSYYEEMKKEYGNDILIPTSVPGSKEPKKWLMNIFGVTIYYV